MKNESTPPLTDSTIAAQLEKPQFHHAAGIELVARKKGFKLIKRIPSEPLRITDDPNQGELVDGVRYIHPNRAMKFELVFTKE